MREDEYKNLRDSIDIKKLGPIQKQQLWVQDSFVELQNKNLESAYKILVKSHYWDKMDYYEKARVAHIFFLHGAAQQSKDILKEIEAEAEQKKDIQFWLEVSLNEVLLGNKLLVIDALQKAKGFSKGTESEKAVLSHSNKLMMRYAPEGEVDRLMEGVFEYDSKYPDDKIVRRIKAIDGEGKPTEEIKSIQLKQRKWYEDIKLKFRSLFITSYFLENILNITYAEILSLQNDPEFIIELSIPNEQFEKELLNNLKKAKKVVFDYASLLNFSKMNLLGHLGKLGKQLYVTHELFVKIQSELLTFEQEDLRRLWDFLRNSKEINIIEESNIKHEDEEISKIFDKWIVDSIKLAKNTKAVFVADDLRFLKFLQSENIKGCNSLIILKNMFGEKWIDNKIYSTSIGDLAERFYTFLGFTGDDLFQIVMEDHAKITLRSYHLANQLFLPGSIASSFSNVFMRFIDLLWQTGSLPKDKVNWLEFLTVRILKVTDKLINTTAMQVFAENKEGFEEFEYLRNKIAKRGGVIKKEEFQTGTKLIEKIVEKSKSNAVYRKEFNAVFNDLERMWLFAIERSDKNEFTLIEEKIEEVLSKHPVTAFKESFNRLIEAKKASLSKKNANN